MIEKALRDSALRAGADIIGFADVRGVRGAGKFQRAVSLGIAYAAGVVAALHKDPARFHWHLAETREQIHSVIARVEQVLLSRGFRTFSPAVSSQRRVLTADFSHKIAATRAGLGWSVGTAFLFQTITAAAYGSLLFLPMPR